MSKHPPTGPGDPRPTTSLDDPEAWPFGDGADEIVIRVSRYASDDLTRPMAFQVITKHRDRTLIWGVGVLANPVAAINRSISEFYKHRAEERGWPDGGEHGRSREPILDQEVEDLLG